MGTTELRLDYVPAAQIASRRASEWADVLGVVGFSRLPRVETDEVPTAASMTPALGATAESVCEVWRAARPLESARHGRVHYRHGANLLFGALRLEEQSVDPSAATELAYSQIFEALESSGHRHLVRVWNYLPEITAEADGEERYRRFNSARQAAFIQNGRPVAVSVPAACALGSPPGSPMSIFFLAARQAPKTIENPRQTSAYRYPPKFGPHSPSFSRACLLSECAGTNLFVSGTASIVGHETMHPGDVRAQTLETVANLESLIEEANRVAGAKRYSLDVLKLKVYVRRAPDFEVIQSTLRRSLSPAAPIVYLQADVCRKELLVEIEATGAFPAA